MDTPVKEESDKVRINLWMSKKLFNYIEYVASRDEVSMSDVIRDAIKKLMAKDKKIELEEPSAG